MPETGNDPKLLDTVADAKSGGAATEPEPPAHDHTWHLLKREVKVQAAQKDGSVWNLAVPFLNQTGFLKIEATGKWTYSSQFQLTCSANGHLLSPLSSKQCVHENSPVGCLIGRIGGSLAARTQDSIFTVGSYLVKKLDVDTNGPLYLAINDMWSGFDDNSGELTVNIFIASLPAATVALSAGGAAAKS